MRHSRKKYIHRIDYSMRKLRSHQTAATTIATESCDIPTNYAKSQKLYEEIPKFRELPTRQTEKSVILCGSRWDDVADSALQHLAMKVKVGEFKLTCILQHLTIENYLLFGVFPICNA
jgi:hypothetical protein